MSIPLLRFNINMPEKTANEAERQSWDDDASTVATRKSRTNEETLDATKKAKIISQLGCRELVPSNTSIPKATPSVQLHCTTCACFEKQRERQDDEDKTLARRIQAASAVCRAKRMTSSRGGTSSPNNNNTVVALTVAFQSVGRWLTSTAPNPTKVAELCFACSALDISKVTRFIFDEGIPINSRNQAGTTPLIAAVRAVNAASRPRAHLAMLNFLIDAGADVNTTTGVHTPPGSGTMSVLAVASSLGLADIVRLLVDRGAAVDAPLTTIPMFRFAGHGLTALHAAVFADKPAAVSVLLSHGSADVAAAFDGHRAVNFMDQQATAAAAATTRRRDLRAWTTGITALHLADDSAACAELLLRYGADPEARDGWGRTPLHWAMVSGNVDVVRLLLEAGTPADVLDDDGATPLAVLCARLECGSSRQGHPDIVRMLLAAGANPDLRYPQNLSVKARILLMDEWRDRYDPIFEKFQLGRSSRTGRSWR